MSKLFLLHSEKKSILKKKEFAPKGSKLSTLRDDPFSQGNWCTGRQTGSNKNCHPCPKWRKIYQAYPFNLKVPYSSKINFLFSKKGLIN